MGLKLSSSKKKHKLYIYIYHRSSGIRQIINNLFYVAFSCQKPRSISPHSQNKHIRICSSICTHINRWVGDSKRKYATLSLISGSEIRYKGNLAREESRVPSHARFPNFPQSKQQYESNLTISSSTATCPSQKHLAAQSSEASSTPIGRHASIAQRGDVKFRRAWPWASTARARTAWWSW